MPDSEPPRPADPDPAASPASAERRRWMGALARADRATLEAAWRDLPARPGYRALRQPEVGLTMVRGRMGGTGRRFNLGEMTVARAAIMTEQGTIGFGYVAGRDLRHAELAALFDALLQDDAHRPMLIAALIEPLERAAAAQRAARAEAVHASKVEFFTMVRSRD
jgi:alpha-D-ribose 1-methylphosphonate 5-triphosphate synthase subunit PhnG